MCFLEGFVCIFRMLVCVLLMVFVCVFEGFVCVLHWCLDVFLRGVYVFS